MTDQDMANAIESALVYDGRIMNVTPPGLAELQNDPYFFAVYKERLRGHVGWYYPNGEHQFAAVRLVQ